MVTSKKTTLSLSLALTSLTLWAAPECVWLNPEYDFGAFNEDLGTVECLFKGVNTGNEPLVIMAARANCGCTVPDYDHTPVAPGDTVKLRVRYNANGRPGRFDKKIYVYTNTLHDKYTLTVKGTVIGSQNTIKSRYPVAAGPIQLNATLLPMGEVAKGHSLAAYIKAYNVSDHPVTPSLTGLPSYLSYEVRGDKIAPGEQFIISVTAFSDKAQDWGLVTDTVTLIPDAGSDLRIPITTVFTIKEDFSKLSTSDRAKAPKAVAETDRIDFGRFSRNAQPLTRTVKIQNKGTSKPLFIRKVFTPADGITLTVDPPRKGIQKGASIPLTVTVDPSRLKDEEILNARITLITNDPDNPTQIIRVIGEYQP